MNDKIKINWEIRMQKIEDQLTNHCAENNEHFARIEKSQETILAKIDKFSDVVSTKADKVELTAIADAKANKDDLKELRNWVVGGILISILLMTVSMLLKN